MKPMIRLLPACCLLLAALSGSAFAQQLLTAADVQRIINQASSRAAAIGQDSTIAVVDREGNVLVVWAVDGAATPQQIGDAVSRAGTGCFLNSNQNALTTRSANFLVQENFPPGIRNRNNGPLTGVNFSHLPYSDVNRFRAPPFPDYTTLPAFPSIASLGAPIQFTSLSGFCGGLPLYKQGILVGGVGVVGDGDDAISPAAAANPDIDEDIALAGQIGFEAPASIRANRIFLDGISVPYVRSSTSLPPVVAPVGAALPAFPLQGSPLPATYPLIPNAYPDASTNTAFAAAGIVGELRAPIITDPLNPSANRLTQQDVERIIIAAYQRALITRSAVRRPLGGPTVMWFAVVGNANDPTVAPPILGILKMPDAVTRSWEFAVQKARTCVGFSSNRFALSTRSVGFLSQRFYPPGINGTSSGPFFGLQPFYSDSSVFVAPNSYFRNGITIFPGGTPLYKGTELVGAIGISGDAIDQDDLVACAGSAASRPGGGTYTAPPSIRADYFSYRGARLPFAKFPRQPTR